MMRPSANPFRAERISAMRYRSSMLDSAGLLRRFEAAGRRGAIVGGQGTGKSTLLREFAEAVPGLGLRARLVRLRRDDTRPLDELWRAPPRPDEVILLDSAGTLGRLRWERVRRRLRRAAGVLVTQHVPGRLPTLVETSGTTAVLADLVGELAPGWSAALEPVLPALVEHCAGNLRDALRLLYDAYAGRPVALRELVDIAAASEEASLLSFAHDHHDYIPSA
ncbi:MAG: hypothetical protein ACYTF9_03445 [Planctomycetota bacterium]|jgi:hypothetical protein